MANYKLKYVEAEAFYGFASVTELLVALAAFSLENNIIAVDLTFDYETTTHGATVAVENV